MKIAPNTRTTLLSFPCLAVFLLLLTSTASASAQAAGDGKANATQLAESADRAVGLLVKAARSSKDRKLSPSASSGKPFWASVKRLNQAVDKLGRVQVEEATAGDVTALVGLESVTIGDTISDPYTPRAMPRLEVDEPTLQMVFGINTSPLAGREGKYLTTRHLNDRLQKEL